MYRKPRTVEVAQRRIGRNMAIGYVPGHANLVCASCGSRWTGTGSPETCGVCGRYSYAKGGASL